jgi:hypothetical protein
MVYEGWNLNFVDEKKNEKNCYASKTMMKIGYKLIINIML